jgi:hypothetical protein
MRRVTAGCAALLTSAALAGCGGGIPQDASVKDFCKAGEKFSSATKFDAGVKAAENLEDTGTPKNIPDNARDGFEVVVDMVTGSKDTKDLQKRFDKLSNKDKSSMDAPDKYIRKTC